MRAAFQQRLASLPLSWTILGYFGPRMESAHCSDGVGSGSPDSWPGAPQEEWKQSKAMVGSPWISVACGDQPSAEFVATSALAAGHKTRDRPML